MLHQDYISTHFFHRQFGNGTVSQVIRNQPHPYHHLSISLRKTFRRYLNIITVVIELVRYYTQDLEQNAAYKGITFLRKILSLTHYASVVL